LRKAEGDSWPDLSDAALARPARLAGAALYDKTSLKDFRPAIFPTPDELLPWELRARLEREAPTHFEAPTGTMLAIDYEAEQGPTDCGASAGIVRAQHPSLDSQGRRAAGASNCCRRRSGRCR
jgi:hypothetical protein